MTCSTPIILRASPQDFIEISGIKKYGDGSGYTPSLTVGSGRFSCSGHPFYFNDLEKFTQDITKAYDRVEGNRRDAESAEAKQIEMGRGWNVSLPKNAKQREAASNYFYGSRGQWGHCPILSFRSFID
jgi:hypothetical protein